MAEDDPRTVVANPWTSLRRHTSARIALGRAGTSLPTQAHLDFQLAHARARNAVHHPLDVAALRDALLARGLQVTNLHSAAATRADYLQRPDHGRRLDHGSAAALATRAYPGDHHDVVFVIGDGLSALAIERHAVGFLDVVMPVLTADGWKIAPVFIVSQARVAIGDEIGERLGTEFCVVLIGERPGLSAADSMGLYMTRSPRIGLTDEARNCISNIHFAGLSYSEAANKLTYLLTQARMRRYSGVFLKDEAEVPPKPMTPTGPRAQLSNDV
jgi:ethanolamine ammonia-lyase small subunit